MLALYIQTLLAVINIKIIIDVTKYISDGVWSV